MSVEKLLKLNNLSREFTQLYDNVRGGTDCTITSLAPAERAHVATHFDLPVLYVVPDSFTLSLMYKRIKGFCPTARVLEPKDDLLIYRKAFQQSKISDRLRLLFEVLKGEVGALVTTPQALAEYYPSPSRLRQSIISLKVGEEMDITALADSLVAAGYTREAGAEEKSTFAISGDTVTVFPPYEDLPLRISFWGDEIESIKIFDSASMITVRSVTSADIYPCNDLLVSEREWDIAIASATKACEKECAAGRERRDEILQSISAAGCRDQCAQWLLPYLKESRASIFSYLDNHWLVALEEDGQILDKLRLFLSEHASRVDDLRADGEALKAHKLCVMDEGAIISAMSGYTQIGLFNVTSTARIVKPKALYKMKCSPIADYTLNYKALYEDLKNYRRGGVNVVLCMGDKRTARAISESLQSEDIACLCCEEVGDTPSLYVTPYPLAHGVGYPQSKLVIIGRDDVIRRSDAAKVKASSRAPFVIPKVGDYVVHEIHGIGRCVGVKRMSIRDIERDYVSVEYAGGEMLYVPIDQTERLSRYSGSDSAPKLSKIGGKDFEKLKSSVKKSLKKLALDLVALYSERMKNKGYTYSPDTSLQTEFEQAFEYEDTPDQARATAEIKSDMERGIVMDRLLCGDVGYGKTEVALRAIFKTVTEGKQAVMLAPTTVLARQHYNTAMDRFRDYGIGIELLTRFQSAEEIKSSLEKIKTGKSMLAVATHRILGKDVKFYDLGLLVLDEEQRFGVEQKEKLKVVKKNVNVLTLSATPIPRTLNMALTGIRDISLLETPPKSRLPVQTYVTELTDSLLKDAISKEIGRGGQVFVLFNRVDGIERVADKITSLVPAARVTVGHGQMDSVTLEDSLNAFYNRQADVLVCTTIIENGIDVPDANTLIVCDADKMGLSQLYQLRGRVGRRNRLAYAYFTTRQGAVITTDAAKRLKSLMDYTELGSGFRIAMRDLEIRGAGSVLGREQHGHIEKVGYDMYCKLLKECLDEAQGVPEAEYTDCEITADMDAYLDSSYISDVNDKLKIYHEISSTDSRAAADALIDKLSVSYGKPPMPLINMIDISLVRNLACKAGIERIFLPARGGSVTFADSRVYKKEGYLATIGEYKDSITLTAEDKPRLIIDVFVGAPREKLKLLEEILTKMCSTSR
ncbi:MAG: transcription-repair coupling factor [Clostridia bacterium]|nr:transcription-repair coupling factor [Clostridia bacterium]